MAKSPGLYVKSWPKLIVAALCCACLAGPALGQDEIATLGDLQSQLAQGDLPASLPELLQTLAPALRENYVLIHDSRSLQAATPQQPRVVLYHPETGFMLAYTGAAGRDGTPMQTVEMIQFNAASGDFDFAELDYGLATPAFKMNPSSCTTCHTKGQRPNWFTYPLWPGAYDARDSARPTSAIEVAHFENFRATAEGDPIYGVLEDLAGYFGRAPSTSFNDFLNPMNRRFIAAELTRVQDFGPWQYALAAALTSCGDRIEDFIPADLRAAHFSRAHAAFKTETSDWMQSAYERRFQRFVELNDGEIGQYPYLRPSNFLMQGFYRHHVAALRYLLDQQGPATFRLFFALDRRSFQTPWSSGLISARIPGVEYSGCRDLKEQSLAALADWQRDGLSTPRWAD